MRYKINLLFVMLLVYGCTASIYQIRYYPGTAGYVKLKPSAIKIFVEDFEDGRTSQEKDDLSLQILFAEGTYDRYFAPSSEALVKEALIQEILTAGVAEVVDQKERADYVINGSLQSFKKNLEVDYYPMWAETFNPGYAYNCNICVDYSTALLDVKNNQKVWEKSRAFVNERKNKAMYLFHWPVVLARGCQEALSQAVSANITELAYVLEKL